MRRVDHLLSSLHHRIRREGLLYRLTLGTRVLLAVGFIPTGMVKLLGYRFAYMSVETRLGGFFETLYQSGPYWHFLGFVQVLAGILILLPATATLGALLFFGIIANIFVITISYDFRLTPVITGMMLLATVYLLIWDYDRLRSLVGLPQESKAALDGLPQHRLCGTIERSAYVIGVVAGLGFFSGTRGLLVPHVLNFWFLLGCVASLLLALWFGIVQRKTTEAKAVSHSVT